MSRIQCRWSQSLGELEGTHQKAWGTKPYTNRQDPTVFFGLYDLRDYIALWRHKGYKWILWAGGDIRNLRANFVFNDGKLLWLSQLFANQGYNFRDWIIKHLISKCENWCEDEAEAWQLKDMGIKVDGIGPSFMGDMTKYPVSFKPGNKVYISASGNRQAEYGWGIVESIASSCPEIEFHLYGTEPTYHQLSDNMIYHGRVSKHRMNREIKQMQCGLRLNKHDGFSEITAKSVLWGQYPITYLYYPEIDQYTNDNIGRPDSLKSLNNLVKLLKRIPKIKKPNIEARNYYLTFLNDYPWNQKEYRMVA